MSIEALAPNYSRQMIKQFMTALESPSLQHGTRRELMQSIELAAQAEKFMLPPGGRLYDDPDYRALDENEPLRLPYPEIALEYAANATANQPTQPGEYKSSKRIVLAREEPGFIAVRVIWWHDERKMWLPMPQCAIRVTGYIDRTDRKDGYACIKALAPPDRPASDYSGELGALLCFLNTLSCSNVKINKIGARRAGKKAKSPLPFDDYHVLVVESGGSGGGRADGGGTHRSPREHLRRGHIRRLESGKKIWVNAAVVSAGKGGGKITKDYAIA